MCMEGVCVSAQQGLCVMGVMHRPCIMLLAPRSACTPDNGAHDDHTYERNICYTKHIFWLSGRPQAFFASYPQLAVKKIRDAMFRVGYYHKYPKRIMPADLKAEVLPPLMLSLSMRLLVAKRTSVKEAEVCQALQLGLSMLSSSQKQGQPSPIFIVERISPVLYRSITCQ